MATYALMYIGRQYLLDPAGCGKTFPNPWLVWSPPKRAAEAIMATGTFSAAGRELDEPTAIEIVKGDKSAFAFGITVGHSENNDIILRHEQVSRFHAYFQVVGGKLSLVDADSRNGTFIDGVRLTPSKAFPLPPEARLRFGELEVRFFQPERMMAFLEKESLGG